MSVLGIVTIAAAVAYTICAVAAIPNWPWAIRVQRAAVALAGVTCGLYLVAGNWLVAVMWALISAAAVLNLSAKRASMKIRELEARRRELLGRSS